MPKYNIGDLLVCLYGDEETPILGYIADIRKDSALEYKFEVQWVDDQEGETWEYGGPAVAAFRELFLEQNHEI